MRKQLCLIKKAILPSPMNVIAVITDPEEVKKILRYLVKVGRSPPVLDPNFV